MSWFAVASPTGTAMEMAMQRSPAEPKGVNSEGLKRRGFDAAQIANIKSAYRLFYRSGLRQAEAAEQLRALAQSQPELQPFVEFLGASERSIIR